MSPEFYTKFDQATSRKPSVLSRSILSRRNFSKIESLEESDNYEPVLQGTSENFPAPVGPVDKENRCYSK